MQPIDKISVIPENIFIPTFTLLLSFNDILNEIILSINIKIHNIESILLNINVALKLSYYYNNSYVTYGCES